MIKKRILVVENEIIIADNICFNLEELGYEPLEFVLSFDDAIKTIEKEKIDLAILDINISGSKTGIDIAREINSSHNFPFIFLTSNSDSATVKEAIQVRPSAYLVKPFTKEELYSAIELALFSHEKLKKDISEENALFKKAFFVKDKGVTVRIQFEDILYFKSDHVYIEIFLKEDKKQIFRSNFNEVLSNLSSAFIQVHRSYIINAHYIESVSKTILKINNELIPIGEKYKEELKKKLIIITQ
jgi:DNA-binding LytR/AlgR family response regulator